MKGNDLITGADAGLVRGKQSNPHITLGLCHRADPKPVATEILT